MADDVDDQWDMPTRRDLYLVRSDQGDGGWSLHLHGSEDEETGLAPVLISGPSEWDAEKDDWERPDERDYSAALVIASATKKPASP